MNYKDFLSLLQAGGLITDNWRNILSLIETEYSLTAEKKDEYLKTLVLYFALIDDGNVYMTLDPEALQAKLQKKIEGLRAEAEEEEEAGAGLYHELAVEVAAAAGKAACIAELKDLVGPGKLFEIKDNKLYTRKHLKAVEGILSSAKRLLKDNPIKAGQVDYKSYVKKDFRLSSGQERIISSGVYNNLLVTGGPGTGKTTSVFFLLLSLLLENPQRSIYLTAPSSKAASRMKDSILSSADLLTNNLTSEVREVIDRLKRLETYTIHRLLEYSPIENCFKYNGKQQFEEKAIFVVDEASMIDLEIFAGLLGAIPDSARLFILGDKNQLPSVECGAVFGALLQEPAFQNNIVELDESKRFANDSAIYRLAETIKAGGAGDLSYIRDKWQPWESFDTKADATEKTPIYYYLDNAAKEREMVDTIVQKFYGDKSFYTSCNDLADNAEEAAELADLDRIWALCEDSRILCACNKGVRGIQHINQVLIKRFFAGRQRISGFFPGELLIVTRNNKLLDLYNGDCGVAVKFAGDDTLYLMLRKSSKLALDNKKVDNKVFCRGNYLFYPIRLISSEDISPAFAITIHKSQGSDYNNILVILPKQKGHPLLNRQIVYTAITRTKHNTYILANQDNLETAKNTVLERDTF